MDGNGYPGIQRSDRTTGAYFRTGLPRIWEADQKFHT